MILHGNLTHKIDYMAHKIDFTYQPILAAADLPKIPVDLDPPIVANGARIQDVFILPH